MRSGYSEDYGDEYPGQMELYRAAVDRAISGKRGQSFLRELVATLEAMPEKRLVEEALQTEHGEVCAMGAVARSRGIPVGDLDPKDAHSIGKALNIAESMAREIAFVNDDDFSYRDKETPEQRYTRVLAWASYHIREGGVMTPPNAAEMQPAPHVNEGAE